MSRFYSANVATNQAVVTSAETVVTTLSGISSARAGETIRFHGQVSILTGVATTAIILRVRATSLAGAIVDEPVSAELEAVAGSRETHDLVVVDLAPGELAGATYVLTVEQTAATADGSVQHASLKAEIA